MIEDYVTMLRRYCLEHYDDHLLGLAYAIAGQCFYNEYVFDESDAERAAVDALHDRLNGTEARLSDIVLYACYRPLYTHEKAGEYSASMKGMDSGVNELLKHQVDDPAREEVLKTQIKAVGRIDNDVSVKVRKQYEENPYPRWQSFGLLDASPDGNAGDKPGDLLLIAGCGTGKQIFQSRFDDPHSEIVAVDLSRASLAYAMRKVAELELENVTFYQADILELRELLNLQDGRLFDRIECTGVLHHMEDPLAGWQVLTDVLKPGGRMLVGLYSSFARRNIVAVRKFIAEKGFASDAAGIRACRAALRNLSDADDMAGVVRGSDFYTMSTCRDLLFHVQEHRFTIKQIENALEELGLEFDGFEIPDAGIVHGYKRMFIEDPEMKKLDNWHNLERNNPYIFAGMYQFYAKKPIVNEK